MSHTLATQYIFIFIVFDRPYNALRDPPSPSSLSLHNTTKNAFNMQWNKWENFCLKRVHKI